MTINNTMGIQYDQWNFWADAETSSFAGPNFQLNKTFYNGR